MKSQNELIFEAMLEKAKRDNFGNPLAKELIYYFSFEYNQQQYDAYIRHIYEENIQITNIYNQIRKRGGVVTFHKIQKLRYHIQLRNEYEAKRMKHFSAAIRDIRDIVNLQSQNH